MRARMIHQNLPIKRAAIAKNCARFCHCTRRRSIKRRYASWTRAVGASEWSARSARNRRRATRRKLVHNGEQPAVGGPVPLPPRHQQPCHIVFVSHSFPVT